MILKSDLEKVIFKRVCFSCCLFVFLCFVCVACCVCVCCFCNRVMFACFCVFVRMSLCHVLWFVSIIFLECVFACK